jgi:20S proteasome alpha/beta subunit
MLKHFPLPTLPKPLRKPYIRPNQRENKAMTVVVGFRCSGGIVIGADRQVTAAGSHKYEEQKIFNVEGLGDSIVFAYSGLPSLAKEARDKILSKCSNDISGNTVYEAADTVLTEMGRLYTDLNLQMLIGIATYKESPDLIKFDGKGLQYADDYNFLGIGESSLLRFLAEKMYSSDMNMYDAANLAIYFVQKAKDYIDGCGGPTDIAMLTEKSGLCETLSQVAIQNIIQQMEGQESQLTDLIVRKPFSF